MLKRVINISNALQLQLVLILATHFKCQQRVLNISNAFLNIINALQIFINLFFKILETPIKH